MSQHELGDGAGIARQQLAMRPTGQAVMRRLNRLLGRNALLMRSRGSANTHQASDLRDLESGVAVQQKMTEQTRRIVILAAALLEGKRRLQQAALFGGQSIFSNLHLGKPLAQSAVRGGHDQYS